MMNDDAALVLLYSKSKYLFLGRLCIIFFLLLISTSSFAQLQLRALPRVHPIKKASTKVTRTQTETPLAIPFWDDFSVHQLDSNNNPIANSALWQNSASISVNNGMAIDPPSIFVATFDGLDSTNLAYTPTQLLLNGLTDKLESKPIDLSTVATDHQDSVYLSFFYQWKGNGEAPNKNDYLVLQFKDAITWNEIDRFYAGDSPQADSFIFHITKIEAKYLINSFQFRIIRFGRESGPFDTWNVDYFYLNDNRFSGANSFPDRALVSQTSPIFGTYRSIPLKHLKSDTFIDSLRNIARNLKNGDDNIEKDVSIGANINLIKYDQNGISQIVQGYIPLISKGLLYPFQKKIIGMDTFPKSKLDTAALKIQVDIKTILRTYDTADVDLFRFDPIDFRVNDTLYSSFTLADYYSYDDAIAEYGVVLNQPNNIAVQQFDLLVDEGSLIGVDIYFPNYGTSGIQTTRILVYDDDNGKPGSLKLQPKITVDKKKPNIFQRTLFSESVHLTGSFYVGWQEQSSTDQLVVGLDKGNNQGNKIFINSTTVSWDQNTLIEGSIMIRPVFGKDTASVITGLPADRSKLITYPNPNNGTFFIRGEYDQLHIINTTGQSVEFIAEEFGEEKKITMNAASGLYLVLLQKGNFKETKKIIIR